MSLDGDSRARLEDGRTRRARPSGHPGPQRARGHLIDFFDPRHEQNRSDRRQRQIPLSRAAGGSQPGARGDGCRHQGRGVRRSRAGGARRAGGVSLGVARPARQVHQDPQGGRRVAGGDGRPGEAREDFLRDHPGHDADVRARAAQGPEHRCADFRGRRRDARQRASSCSIRRRSCSRCSRARGRSPIARRTSRSAPTSSSDTAWRTRLPRSTSARRSR